MFFSGDPPENQQGSALFICFANTVFYVPFASQKMDYEFDSPFLFVLILGFVMKI